MKRLGSLRVRVASPDNAIDLAAFLEREGYPHEWDIKYLRDCMLIRIGTPVEPWGWWWFHWIDGCDFVMEAHVCIAKKFRVRWMTPFVLDRLFAIVDMVGAKTVLARPPSNSAARILKRLGFTQAGPFMMYDVQQEEDPYGRDVQQAKEVRASPGSEGGGAG